MTSIQQRAELHRQIWQIANDVRGSVDGWDFKQYVLGALFYRFISENFSSYIEAGDDSICYAKLDDSVITDDIKDDAIKTKGYFIYPSQLFCNVAAKANTNDRLNADLNSIFVAIESSAYGYPSEADIKGLFADFDTTSNRLGNTVKDKNARLAAVLKGVEGLKLGDFHEHQIDLFGDAYEFLISNYAANAGKSGGEFFTPQHVSLPGGGSKCSLSSVASDIVPSISTMTMYGRSWCACLLKILKCPPHWTKKMLVGALHQH